MKIKKVILAVLSAISSLGCTSYGPPTPGQIKCVAWETKHEIVVKDEWLSIAPPILIETKDTAQIIVMFNANCAGAPKPISGPNNLATDLWGVPILVRIKINDQVASPHQAILTSSPFSEMKTFVATLMNLPPDNYRILVEVKSSSEKGWLQERTVTVWESRKGELIK